MAATEPSRYLARSLPRAFVRSARPQAFWSRRNNSDHAPARSLSDDLNELEAGGALAQSIPSDEVKSFDPVAKAKARKTQLPSSR